MRKQFLRNIQVLKAAIADRKLVIFVGAGASVDAGIPMWGELIDKLREDIDIPKNESDFLRIAQLYYNERQQKEFIDRIREILKHKKLRYNEIHQEIFNLNPEHIITTNFDDLLEQVIKSKAYPFAVIKKDSELPYARNTKLLIKMHGDLDEANLVIKEDDYLEYAEKHPLIESFIKGIFTTKVILFVGYSFSDLNLKILLQGIRNILGNDFQNAYLLSVDDDFHPSQRQYLRNKGITVINYHDGGKINEDEYIDQFLFKGTNAKGHPFAKMIKGLSSKGSKLLYMLQFISKYDAFAESIFIENVVFQMNESLNRFKSIRVLPPKFLSNLYPFNISNEYTHNYNGYTLGSNNKQMFKFFFEEFDSQTLKVKDIFFKNNNIPISGAEELNKKLETILKKLNFSFILYFGKTDNQFETFDFGNEKISLKMPLANCSCLSCKFNVFDFKGFLKDLEDCTITETSDLENDMRAAYFNYKTGNFKKSISQFEEIANKAWQIEEYIIYFIAQHNIKTLTNLYKKDFESEGSDSKRNIVERISNLDLDKLLFQVPKLDDDVYKLLKIIRDDDVLLTTEKKINKTYDKIVEIYEAYRDRNVTISGTYYPQVIYEELSQNFLFYTYNFIVIDEYTDFRNVYKKGIKALLISYATDEKYQSKLLKFDSLMIRFMIQYGEDDELEKTLIQYSITELKIRKEDLNTIVAYIYNLFDSVFDEHKLLGRNVIENKKIAKQSINSFFQDRLRTIMHNVFLIYSLIDINEENGKTLSEKFLCFLTVEKILIPYSERYFNEFFKKVISYFTFEQIIEVLNIFQAKPFLTRSDKFFKIIANAIKISHSEKWIENTELVKNIIKQSIILQIDKHERGFMHLWGVSNAECKKLITTNLKQDLLINFYSIDYFEACNIGALEPSEFYTRILKEIEGVIPNDFKLSGEWNFYSDLTLINFIYMIYNKNLLHDEVPYSRFDKLPNYAQFYFRPYSFDYSKFDVNWLIPLKSSHFFEHLKNIPEIKAALEKSLRLKYDEQFSEIYSRFFILQNGN